MVFAPMLEESGRLLDGLAFLLIDGAAGSIGQASSGKRWVNSNSFILQWNFKLGAKVSIFRDSAKFFGRLIADNHFFFLILQPEVYERKN